MDAMSGNNAIMRWLRHLRCSESGSALVESALIIFLIFIPLLLGAVEFGDIAYKADEMTNAARTAAQYATATSGAYTDCTGSVPGSSPVTCSTTSGIYATAQNDAPMAYKSCTSFTVQAASSCTCSDATACTSSSTAGYACASGRPVISISVYTSAQCSPAASVPNLFPTGTKLTLTGFSQQEVTQ